MSAAAGALCAFGVLGITGSLSASTAQLRPRSAPPTGTLEGSSMPVVPIPHTTLMLTTTQDMSVGAHTRVSLPDRVTTAKVVQVQPTLRMSLLVDIGRSTPIGTAPARRTAGSDTQIGDGLSCVQHRVQVKAAARGTAARMPAAEPRRVQLASGDTALGTYRSQQGPMPAGCAVVDVSGELVGMAIGYDDNPDDDVHYLLTVDGARTLFEQSASEPHG